MCRCIGVPEPLPVFKGFPLDEDLVVYYNATSPVEGAESPNFFEKVGDTFYPLSQDDDFDHVSDD